MNEFIVVFREALEASLIVGIIGTTLVKLGRREGVARAMAGLGVGRCRVDGIGVGALRFGERGGGQGVERRS